LTADREQGLLNPILQMGTQRLREVIYLKYNWELKNLGLEFRSV
jgi:hypothetical protein